MKACSSPADALATAEMKATTNTNAGRTRILERRSSARPANRPKYVTWRIASRGCFIGSRVAALTLTKPSSVCPWLGSLRFFRISTVNGLVCDRIAASHWFVGDPFRPDGSHRYRGGGHKAIEESRRSSTLRRRQSSNNQFGLHPVWLTPT